MTRPVLTKWMKQVSLSLKIHVQGFLYLEIMQS